jgi:hypothetical protein
MASVKRRQMVPSPFSIPWDAHIRTCPTVVTSGMTGSEHSFAALCLGARPCVEPANQAREEAPYHG